MAALSVGILGPRAKKATPLLIELLTVHGVGTMIKKEASW